MPIQCSTFKMHCLRSIEMESVVSESSYKGTIFQWNYRKMTIKCHFPIISFVKFHGKKFWEP